MTYEDLLMGMFLEDEQLVPVRPLLITNFRKCNCDLAGWPVEEEKFNLRLFLTNKRIFILDAELHEHKLLERDEAQIKSAGVFCVDRLSITHAVDDDLFYQPIPLNNITGLSFQLHYNTKATGWLFRSRPWWAIFVLVVGASIALLATALAADQWKLLTTDVSATMLSAGSGSEQQPAGTLSLYIYGSRAIAMKRLFDSRNIGGIM